MGSMDDYPRKPLQQQNSMRAKLKFLLLLVATNLLSIFLFSGSGVGVKMWGYTPSIYLSNSNMLLRELNATQNKLSASQELSAELYKRLGVANSLLETIIAEMGQEKAKDIVESSDGWQRELDGELKLAVGPHKLPLGYTPNLGTDEMYPVLGSECRRFQDELIQYMSYQAGGECPSDDVFAQRLMLKGCEPLPRRRCHPKSPVGYVEPTPFPESMWTIPPDTSIVWDPYTSSGRSITQSTKSLHPNHLAQCASGSTSVGEPQLSLQG